MQIRSPTKHNFISSSNTGTKNIKCFKCSCKGHITSDCPTRRTMIMKADGEITSESEISGEEDAGTPRGRRSTNTKKKNHQHEEEEVGRRRRTTNTKKKKLEGKEEEEVENDATE